MPLISVLLPSVWYLLWGCNLLISIHVNHAARDVKKHAAHSVCGNHKEELSDMEKECMCTRVGVCVWLCVLWNNMMKTTLCGEKILWWCAIGAERVNGACLLLCSALKGCVCVCVYTCKDAHKAWHQRPDTRPTNRQVLRPLSKCGCCCTAAGPNICCPQEGTHCCPFTH